MGARNIHFFFYQGQALAYVIPQGMATIAVSLATPGTLHALLGPLDSNI
jgi:hypothetical protein